MKVLLLDLDTEKRRRVFPNLALMKLSAFHKAEGDEVWLNFPLCQAEITYASCVFSWHKPKETNPTIFYGGSGINFIAHLRDEVEHIMPDYSLYPSIDFSLGFTSRGCIRKCPFCIVPGKEGKIQAWASVKEFFNPRFKRIVLLDNNLLAAPNWKETLIELADLGRETDINQGMDIRLLDDEHLHYLKAVKMKTYRFAFDNIAYEQQVKHGIDLMLRAGIHPRKLSFYVLVGFGRDDGAIERVKLLQSYGVDIYPMVYKDETGKEPKSKIIFNETIMFKGARQNLRKFLRICKRLP